MQLAARYADDSIQFILGKQPALTLTLTLTITVTLTLTLTLTQVLGVTVLEAPERCTRTAAVGDLMEIRYAGRLAADG